MTELKTYTAAKVERLIADKKPIDGPYRVEGSLYLRGAQNPDIEQWWNQKGGVTKAHCIAISDYALIQTDAGKFIAGCRGPWTKKQALAHWGKRTDVRAKLFVQAIEGCEA